MNEAKVMIDLQHVSKWYKDFQVLTDCTTQIRQGEVAVFWSMELKLMIRKPI